MTDENRHKLRPADQITVYVADEGNIPAKPSTTAAIAIIAALILVGLGFIHFASLYGPSHVDRTRTPTATAAPN